MSFNKDRYILVKNGDKVRVLRSKAEAQTPGFIEQPFALLFNEQNSVMLRTIDLFFKDTGIYRIFNTLIGESEIMEENMFLSAFQRKVKELEKLLADYDFLIVCIDAGEKNTG